MKTYFYLFLIFVFSFSSSFSQVSIEYMVHIQSDGWSQGWVQNGQFAGRAKIVERSTGNTGVIEEFRESSDDTKRIEGIKIRLKDAPKNAYVEYSAHSQSFGWKDWVRNGVLGGTEGQEKRMEAIKIRLGNLPGYILSYKVKFECRKTTCQAQKPFNHGFVPTEWSNWMNEGEVAGTTGEHRRLSHIRIKLTKKSNK